MTARPVVEVRPGLTRARSGGRGLDVRHCFSSGRHYDPANTAHGRLIVCDEVVAAGGAGFPLHPHRGEDVLTWVLEGALAHEDSTGRSGLVQPGQVQRLSAGRGVRHGERNADERPEAAPVHLVQMRVVADDAHDPSYASADVTLALGTGELVPLASGRSRDGAVRLTCPSTVLHAARLPPGGSVVLPQAPYLHLLVTRGRVALEGSGPLAAGDAARATATGGQRLTAAGAAEVLLWEMHADLR